MPARHTSRRAYFASLSLLAGDENDKNLDAHDENDKNLDAHDKTDKNPKCL